MHQILIIVLQKLSTIKLYRYNFWHYWYNTSPKCGMIYAKEFYNKLTIVPGGCTIKHYRQVIHSKWTDFVGS